MLYCYLSQIVANRLPDWMVEDVRPWKQQLHVRVVGCGYQAGVGQPAAPAERVLRAHDGGEPQEDRDPHAPDRGCGARSRGVHLCRRRPDAGEDEPGHGGTSRRGGGRRGDQGADSDHAPGHHPVRQPPAPLHGDGTRSRHGDGGRGAHQGVLLGPHRLRRSTGCAGTQ